jgi:hypothetical protein
MSSPEAAAENAAEIERRAEFFENLLRVCWLDGPVKRRFDTIALRGLATALIRISARAGLRSDTLLSFMVDSIAAEQQYGVRFQIRDPDAPEEK